MVRILLIEDDPSWQEGIRALLSADPQWELVGIADHYEAAVEKFRETQPMIVLLDLKIRGERDGLALGKAFIALGLPAERIILISGSSPSSIPPHPFLYIPKSRLAEELPDLLRSLFCTHPDP